MSEPHLSPPHPADETSCNTPYFLDLNEGSCFRPNEIINRLKFNIELKAGPINSFTLTGEWDLDAVVNDHSASIYRSCAMQEESNTEPHWDTVILKFENKILICLNSQSAVAYDSCPRRVRDFLKEFGAKYRRKTLKRKGVFQLLRLTYEITSERVFLPDSALLSDDRIELHYGDSGLARHRALLHKMHSNDRGIYIFEGAPGTGKTHYIRHLISFLSESHRFYYIPPRYISSLADAEFTGFWSEQKQMYPNMKFVLILEDCEAAIQERDDTTREVVSSILNISDGLLSDFLQIQIICTVNCRLNEIDPALLRPGRLLDHRVFERLNRADAERLAEKLGRSLPIARDYSLAEIFAEGDLPRIPKGAIGFGG